MYSSALASSPSSALLVLLTLLASAAHAAIHTGLFVIDNNGGVVNIAWLKGENPCLNNAVLGAAGEDPCKKVFAVSGLQGLKLEDCGKNPMTLTANGGKVADCKPASWSTRCDVGDKKGQLSLTFEC